MSGTDPDRAPESEPEPEAWVALVGRGVGMTQSGAAVEIGDDAELVIHDTAAGRALQKAASRVERLGVPVAVGGLKVEV